MTSASGQRCESTAGASESTIGKRAVPKPAHSPAFNPVRNNVGNTTSRKKAMDAMCAHCMGCTVDRREPGFAEEVRNCSSPGCPIFYYRPYKPAGGAA